MTEFTATTTYTVNCPTCDAGHVKKMGIRNGQQRYLCKACGKSFRANGKAQGRRMDAELMGSAIRGYYTGKSYKQIAEGLKEEYDIPEPSKATVYEWVRDCTDEAVDAMKGRKATTGGHWVADEMQVDVGSKKVWLWNVMDSETRYILASHLTPRRDAQAARVVFRKAVEAADKLPKTITTNKLRSYIRPIKDIMPEARHIQSEGLAADINNLSERLQGTFRDRIKTLRGLDNLKTGQRYLDGWMLTYNLFRGHESLRNKTPGERAKVNPPFREWADVVKAGAASLPVARPETRPVSQSPRKLPLHQAAPKRQDKAQKPLTEIPTVQGEHRARKRSRSRTPKPVFPKMSCRTKPRSLPPRWARLRPCLLGRN